MANRFNRLFTVLFALIVLGIMLAMMGTVMGVAFAPDRGVVSLSAIESGKQAKSGYYAQVSGYAAAPAIDYKTKKGTTRYIPLRSTPSSTNPIHLVILCTQAQTQPCVEPDPRTQMLTVQGYIRVADHIPDQFKSGLNLARRARYILPQYDRNQMRMTFLVIGGTCLFVLVYAFQALGDQG
jgi:hypothetical protein